MSDDKNKVIVAREAVKEDPVNHPSHYQVFPVLEYPPDEIVPAEAIEIIEKVLTPQEFIGFLKGNALKYRLRVGFKDNIQQDVDKAKWYQNKLFEFVREMF